MLDSLSDVFLSMLEHVRLRRAREDQERVARELDDVGNVRGEDTVQPLEARLAPTQRIFFYGAGNRLSPHRYWSIARAAPRPSRRSQRHR